MTMTWPLLDGPPEAIIATDPARRWRRAELIEAAQEAAALLQGAGLAALWLPHRALALAAVVGALQAHTPYLPLDPRAPRALTQATLADANPRRALWPLGEAPPPGAAAPDRHGRWFCSASLTQTPSAQEPPPEAAYLLYTSGSVGRPRGVLQARAGLEGHARRYAASLGLTAQDRLLMLASVATDAAVMDLFGALASGASLHLWDLRAAPLADLEALVAREAITILHMTPTVFRAWVAAAPAPSSLQTARALVLGGERARASDVHHHRRLFPAQSVLINGLGPTECTMALQRRFTAQEPPPDDPLPVGWPLPGIEARLLDEAQDGSGELALCGEDLALGYWRRPEETARAFVALPDGRRLYRTGDKARRGADGQWIALGRLGRAHKIRGVQVDLDALEALLERAPGVARAAVEVEDTARGDRLRAWIAPAPGHALALAPLRAWLRARALPEQIPARWHLLEAPPLTTSGKLDRAALRASSSPQGPSPQTPTGRWLAARWAALLGAEDLHEDSDFFAEGGDSLAALALQDALRRERGVWLPLERLFDSPRLADLSNWIDAQTPTPQQETTGLSDALTPQELGIWLAQAAAPGSDAWHVPALQWVRGGDPAALRRALEEVYAATPGLRRRVARAPGAPPALVEGAAPLPWVALRAASADEGVRMAQAAASAPFDLERGPLLRATWIEVEGDAALLLLVAHHLILDGEGMRALMVCWGARSRGEPLPDDLRLARAPSGEDSAAWWRAQPRHAVSLPAPLEGDPGNDPADKGRQWSLDAAYTGRLRAWAASQRATLGMAALTALAATLSRALGERMTLGLVASAPTRAGWAQAAVQALPLALALDPDEPATALLARARALTLAALERPTPDLAALGPAPQVVFVMHGAPRPALAGQGEALALEPRDSPAPLLFSARDGGAALELGAAWRPEAISPWVAERLVELWAAALERLAATPDASVGALCELTASQRAWLRRQQGARRALIWTWSAPSPRSPWRRRRAPRARSRWSRGSAPGRTPRSRAAPRRWRAGCGPRASRAARWYRC
jgi:acyl-CoA synthetase (AMP-forming)/AMP-acid ligase II/aryl carrier-like protein